MDENKPGISSSDFPSAFVWGVATSAYQIEGAASEDGRSPSIWDEFSHTSGRTRNGETGDVAADHYHRYREDVALMKDLGVDAYRFSIAWPRILPGGVGAVNSEGVAFYRRLCEELRAHDITPFATLYHWDLPLTLHERGGWLNPESVGWFAEYATVAKEALGDLVTDWATLNEPHCTAFLGYSEGVHAPGSTNPADAFAVSHHLNLAHFAAVRAMRSTRPDRRDRFGIALNLIPAWPSDDAPATVRAAAQADAIHSGMFAEPTLHGRYPDAVRQMAARFGVADLVDGAEIREAFEPIDFLGVNYYNVNHFSHRAGIEPLPSWPGAEGAVLDRPPGELTDMGWGVEPEGLTWTLQRVARWAPDLPVIVLENGAAYPDEVDDNGAVIDPERIRYIEQHIAAVKDAIDSGVNVIGYFVWSLLDNFEWSLGYDMRFGLVRVDPETLDRTVKASGRWYRDFISGRVRA